MFSFFKSKAAKADEVTFTKRVEQFWNWYAEEAPRFFETIEAGNCASLEQEVSRNVDKFFPGIGSWVFGPGEGGLGHSFTLSGEGVLHRQLLTQFWHSQAPNLKGWTFYPARQPGSIQGIKMNLAGKEFKGAEFWITPTVNSESEKLDIIAWHPLLAGLDRKPCMTALFLFLDEVLGEYGTGQWIGEITLDDHRLADAIPLGELPALTQNLMAEKGWEKLPPGEAAYGFTRKQHHQRFLRGDIIAGTTTHLPLLNEYLSAEGNYPDPLAGTGADYLFVTMDCAPVPKEQLVDFRMNFEDALDKSLREERNGRTLGGGTGSLNIYIDLIIFDGSESLRTIRRVLENKKAPAGTAIHYFAKEKRGQRIVL